jgi:hypothetical protein
VSEEVSEEEVEVVLGIVLELASRLSGVRVVQKWE